MKFSYYWKDHQGIEHFTDNYEEADRALHNGCFVQLIPQNGKVAG